MDKGADDAVARLCRQYVAFLEVPNEDSIFNWSNALHSLHDRAPKAMRESLFKSDEFVALKALRNHFHHGAEVAHRVKVLALSDVPLVSDLAVLCLIDRGSVEAAIQAIDARFKAKEQPMAERALKWYGPCVNVNPAIFNLMVQVVLLARDHGVAPNDEAFLRLAKVIDRDAANGYSVTVKGDIHCHGASVDLVLADLMSS